MSDLDFICKQWGEGDTPATKLTPDVAIKMLEKSINDDSFLSCAVQLYGDHWVHGGHGGHDYICHPYYIVMQRASPEPRYCVTALYDIKLDEFMAMSRKYRFENLLATMEQLN